MVQTKPTSNWKGRGPGKVGETYTVDHPMEAFTLNKDVAEQLIIKFNGDCKYINDSVNARRPRR